MRSYRSSARQPTPSWAATPNAKTATEAEVSGWTRAIRDKQSSRQGYDASALAYKRHVVPMYRPLAKRLVWAVVVALDLSKGMLLQGEGGSRVTRVDADGERLPFAEGSFDVLTCGFGLEFLPNLAQFLEEVRRVLRPNGTFASYTWAWKRPYSLSRIFTRTLDGLLGPLPADPEADERERLLGTPGRLRRHFGKAGFRPQYLEMEEHLVRFRGFDHFW